MLYVGICTYVFKGIMHDHRIITSYMLPLIFRLSLQCHGGRYAVLAHPGSKRLDQVMLLVSVLVVNTLSHRTSETLSLDR